MVPFWFRAGIRIATSESGSVSGLNRNHRERTGGYVSFGCLLTAQCGRRFLGQRSVARTMLLDWIALNGPQIDSVAGGLVGRR